MKTLLSSVISGVNSLSQSLSSLNDTWSPGLGGKALAILISSAFLMISLLGITFRGAEGAVGVDGLATISAIFSLLPRLFTMHPSHGVCQSLSAKISAIVRACRSGDD